MHVLNQITGSKNYGEVESSEVEQKKAEPTNGETRERRLSYVLLGIVGLEAYCGINSNLGIHARRKSDTTSKNGNLKFQLSRSILRMIQVIDSCILWNRNHLNCKQPLIIRHI